MSLDRFPTDFDVDDIDHDGQGRGLVSWGGVQHPGSNLYVDSSLFGNHGALTNMDPATDWVEGHHGMALDFDDIDDFATFGDVLNLALPLTVSTWIFNRDTGLNSILHTDYVAGAYVGLILYTSSGNVTGAIGNNTGLSASGRRSADTIGAGLVANVWYHLSVAINGLTDWEILVNGKPMTLAYSGTGTDMVHTSDSFVIGSLKTSGAFFCNGLISDVRIYDRALSDSEVWDVYANPTGIILPRRRVFRGASVTTHNLVADGITSGVPTLGSPAIGQVHALTATGVDAGVPTLGTPTLGQTHVLSASGITSGTPTLGEPSIGQTHVLVASGITAGTPTLGTPQLDPPTTQGVVTCRITSANSGVSFSSRNATLTFSESA